MSNLVTLLPSQVKELEDDARSAAFAEVRAVLDAYNESDDDEIAQCAPEDRWRLYRDLHALTGRTSDEDNK